MPIKKKKNRKGKKKTVVADGDSDSSSDGDELDYFATGGGASSSIVSQVRSKKPTAASGADVQDKTVPSHQLAAFQEALIGTVTAVAASVLHFLTYNCNYQWTLLN